MSQGFRGRPQSDVGDEGEQRAVVWIPSGVPFVPASVVINDQMEIVQFQGKTGAYLELAAGQPTFSVSRMARGGLLGSMR